MSATTVNTLVGIAGIFVGIVGTLATIWASSKKKTVTITQKTKVFCSPRKKGTFTFDYSSNNGEYVIGEGDALFRTRWSKASNTSIHAYKDGRGIVSIAILKDAGDVENIQTIEGDFSSRVRTPRVGDAIIWRNEAGKYAITKIVSIKDDTRGDKCDELTCDYAILND